jgi:SulP family sulfate permease
LFKLGSIVNLLTQPVLLGFTTGAAILIVASQLPSVLGVSGSGGVLERAIGSLVQVTQWDWAALGFGVVTIGLMLGGRKLNPLFPGILVAVLLSVLASSLLNYSGATLGELPTAFPPISFNLPWQALTALIVPAIIIAVVGFAEPASIARSFAQKENQSWDANREFAAQGLANIVAGISAGFPVGGSFSRSALNHLAGAKTRLAGLITGIAVLAFLPFMSLLIAMPKATLGAAVIAAILSLIQLKPFLELWTVSRSQGFLAGITLILTLALSPRIDLAVLIAVGLGVLERVGSRLFDRGNSKSK